MCNTAHHVGTNDTSFIYKWRMTCIEIQSSKPHSQVHSYTVNIQHRFSRQREPRVKKILFLIFDLFLHVDSSLPRSYWNTLYIIHLYFLYARDFSNNALNTALIKVKLRNIKWSRGYRGWRGERGWVGGWDRRPPLSSWRSFPRNRTRLNLNLIAI